jgi:hypothetical protein
MDGRFIIDSTIWPEMNDYTTLLTLGDRDEKEC